MADKNKQLNLFKVYIVALVLAEYLAVCLLCGALVVEFFFYYHAVVVFGAAALRAARCGVLLLASGVVAVGVGVGAVAELLRHALHAQIEETDDADKEDGNHKHHDEYAFQK